MKEHLIQLLKELDTLPPGRTSSKSHLKMALYDWNKEGNWDRSNSVIINQEGMGYAFGMITKEHFTLRHIFVLEEHRGRGIGQVLMNNVHQRMNEFDRNIIRFFSDLSSVGFYERLGYQWLGESKTKLPFTYTNINTMKLVHCPKQLNKLYKVYEIPSE